MTSSEPKPDHLERTATEPRDKSLNTVVLSHIEQVNDTTRIFHLRIPTGSPPIRFLPGQWLDVYVPGVEKAGGFTITSTPREARMPHTVPAPDSESSSRDDKAKGETRGPYLELAVQKSPDNPPAAWLWRDPPTSILGEELRIRVGGSFVWPPPGINVRALRRVVFVAGGVGVNPLVAMLSSLIPTSAVTGGGGAGGGGWPDIEVHFLYSLRDPGSSGKSRDAKHMLFLDRIAACFRDKRVKGSLQVFLTRGHNPATTAMKAGVEATVEVAGVNDGNRARDKTMIICEGGDLPFHARRCTVDDDVAAAVGTVDERRFAVVYVCGVPTMTDDFVAKLTDSKKGLGMESHRVLCERWW